MNITLIFLLDAKKDTGTLAILIVISNWWLYYNDINFWGLEYYISEGIRHQLTVLVVLYLTVKNKKEGVYTTYAFLYCFFIIQYLSGAFSILSNIDLNSVALILNVSEVLIFTYAVFDNNNNNSPTNG
jgi:heme/copper-type cytochrome/quinol oxidase subunit 4